MWYIYTMEYYSVIKRNTFESVLMRWMKLEPVIQSEASQMQDNKRDTDVENRLLDSVGEGRAGMI